MDVCKTSWHIPLCAKNTLGTSLSALHSSPGPCDGTSSLSNKLGNWGQERLNNFWLRFSYEVEKPRSELCLPNSNSALSKRPAALKTDWPLIPPHPPPHTHLHNEEVFKCIYLGHVPELLNLNQSYQSMGVHMAQVFHVVTVIKLVSGVSALVPGLTIVENSGPGLWKKLRAGNISPGTTYLEMECNTVEAAGLTKGRVQKEKARGLGENPDRNSYRSRERS